MKKFIILSFAFLGLGFYELSGGADFDPADVRVSVIDARQDREKTRLAALSAPVVAASAAVPESDQSNTAVTASQSVPVTQAGLQLVSFDTVARRSTEPEATPDIAAPTRLERPTDIADSDKLDLTALNAPVLNADTIAFSGNVVTASSIANTPNDIRSVTGSLVNMRSGPGTDYDVVDQLTQSTRVEVLSNSGTGWVELRPVDGGTTGWIAEFLLSGG